jgi:RNA polymerase sigma-70 factor (ECF subfamily)
MERAELGRRLVAELPWLRSRAAKLTAGRQADADDLVQNTCLRALQFSSTYREGNLRGWLAAIMLNVWRSVGRAAARERVLPPEELPEPAIGEAAVTGPVELHRVLRLIEAEMRPAFRDALFAALLLYPSEREAAEALHIKSGTLKSRASRARSWLKQRTAAAA